MCAGAPTQITTVGEARKLQLRRISVASIRKEVLPGRATEDGKPEVAEETPISMEIGVSLATSGFLSSIARPGNTSLLVRATKIRRSCNFRASPTVVI